MHNDDEGAALLLLLLHLQRQLAVEVEAVLRLRLLGVGLRTGLLLLGRQQVAVLRLLQRLLAVLLLRLLGLELLTVRLQHLGEAQAALCKAQRGQPDRHRVHALHDGDCNL